MAWTEHGHHIPGSGFEGVAPEKIEQCGGAAFCEACAYEIQEHQDADDLLTPLRDIQNEALKERLRSVDNSSVGLEILKERFGIREENPVSAEMRKTVTTLFRDLATILDRMLPHSRAKFQTLVNLEEALMWVNKSINEQEKLVVDDDVET